MTIVISKVMICYHEIATDAKDNNTIANVASLEYI